MSSFLLQFNEPDKCTVLYRVVAIYLHTLPRNAGALTVLQICISFFIAEKKKKKKPDDIFEAFKYFNSIRIFEQTSLNLK